MRALIACLAILLLPFGITSAAGNEDAPPASPGAKTVVIDGTAYLVARLETELADGDIYLEAKFDVLTPPNRVKLRGLDAKVIIDDVELLKEAKNLKHDDNLWCCGSLRKFELHLLKLHKLPSDVEIYTAQIAQLASEINDPKLSEGRPARAERVIELGQRIHVKSLEEMNFNTRVQYEQLRDKAYELGLKTQEAALKPGDAEACFELAERWRELRHNLSKQWELMRNCLKLDPNHALASQWAIKEQMEKIDGMWCTRDEAVAVRAQQALDAQQLAAAQRAEKARREKVLAIEVAARPEKLRKMQLALATSDSAKLAGALESACRDIQECVDPGFGVQAVEILAGLEDSGALACGLDAASRHPLAEVRREAYEALAWRSRIQADQEAALHIVTEALKHETDIDTARTGVQALLSTKQKPAIGSLVSTLSSSGAPARQEIIAGLKIATGQQFATADEWMNWWQADGSK
jgi:hypothetical protein